MPAKPLHLTEKISRMRKIGPRSLDRNILPLIAMEEHRIINEVMAYPEYIIESDMYSYFGSFMDYALRRIISRISDIPVVDSRCEDIINGICRSGELKYRPDIIDSIRLSYHKYQNSSLSTRSTLNDVWKVSLSHAMWFGNLAEEQWDEYSDLKLDESGEIALVHRLKTMVRGLGNILAFQLDVRTKDGEDKMAKVMLNPCLSIQHIINADADLIINDTIIDFKCSKNDPINTNNFIQLMGYAALARELKVCEATSIAILNPLSGYIYFQKINNWNHEDFYKFITKV
jgi:hypothetical protein